MAAKKHPIFDTATTLGKLVLFLGISTVCGVLVAGLMVPAAALAGADALVIVTEWNEFKQFGLQQLAEMLTQPVVFDGRNLFDPKATRHARLKYHAIGRR